MPVTIPVGAMLAFVGFPLLHVPPVDVVVRVIVCPTHTKALPEIADGALFTVTVALAEQPVLRV
jgi:hypothetical protein